MNIRCVAIDDEPLALEIIQDYCSRIPFLELLKVFDKPLDSIEFIKTSRVDLIFLDIQMTGFSGINLVHALKKPPLIIFTTAFDAWAVEGYSLGAVDYLLKPIAFERFVKAVNKAFDHMKRNEMTQHPNPEMKSMSINDHFFLKTDHNQKKLYFTHILYVEGYGDYWKIITNERSYLTQITHKMIAEILPPEKFFRVHKSYIVALDKIDSIDGNQIHIGDRTIPISKTYKGEFHAIITKKTLKDKYDKKKLKG